MKYRFLLFLLCICCIFQFCVYANRELTLLNTAENQFKRNNLNRAQRNFGKILHQYPQTIYLDHIYERLGEISYKQRDLANSSKYFQLVIKRFPRSVYSLPARYYQGIIYKEQEKWSNALKIFQTLSYYLPMQPTSLEEYSYLEDRNIKSLFTIKRERAIRWGNLALYQLAECYLATSMYREALQIYEFFKENNLPSITRGTIYQKIGICYFYLNMLSPAREYLERSIDIRSPGTSLKESYRYLGATEYATGNRVDGITHMVKYMELETKIEKQEQARNEILHFMREQLDVKELYEIASRFGNRFPGIFAQKKLSGLNVSKDTAGKIGSDQGKPVTGPRGNLVGEPVSDNNNSPELFTSSSAERKIACVAPLTGALASFGQKVLQGVDLAIRLHNRKNPAYTFSLIHVDTQGDSSRIPQIYYDLALKDRVLAVVGPVLSKVVADSSKYAQQYHLVSMTPSATRKDLPDLSDYTFRNCLTYPMQVETILDYASNNLGIHEFCVLYPNNTYGKTLATEFLELAPHYGINVWQKIVYDEYQTDFHDMLSTLETTNLQGIFIPDFAERIAVIAPQIPFFGIKQFQLFGSDSWNSDSLIKLGGIYMEGAIFVDGFFSNAQNSLVREFVGAYQSYYAEEPDRLAAHAFDATRVIMKVIEDHGVSREKIREYLLKLKPFQGVTGSFQFLPNGDCKKKGLILSVSAGSIIQLN